MKGVTKHPQDRFVAAMPPPIDADPASLFDQASDYVRYATENLSLHGSIAIRLNRFKAMSLRVVVGPGVF